MNKNLITCKSCGKEIAKNAKACPSCGDKNTKPFYKRVWFIVLCIFIVISMIGSAGGDNETSSNQSNTEQSQETPVENEEVPITYEEVSVDTLIEVLDSNALKAETTYNDKYLKITGRLGVIDSDGSYISLCPVNDKWAFLGVQCSIENEEQLAKVMEMKVDDTVVLSGQITEVGEVMGYSLKIDIIE